MAFVVDGGGTAGAGTGVVAPSVAAAGVAAERMVAEIRVGALESLARLEGSFPRSLESSEADPAVVADAQAARAE